MVNKKIWLGMLAMALAFGMTVVSCDDGTTDNSGGGDKPSITTDGSITLTGILPRYEGRYAMAVGIADWDNSTPPYYFGAAKFTEDGDFTMEKISDNKVTLKVWKSDNKKNWDNFDGVGANIFFLVLLHSESTIDMDVEGLIEAVVNNDDSFGFDIFEIDGEAEVNFTGASGTGTLSVEPNLETTVSFGSDTGDSEVRSAVSASDTPKVEIFIRLV